MLKLFVSSIVTRCSNVANFITIKRKDVRYGVNLKLHGRIGFHGSGSFIFGDNVVITSSAQYNPSSGNTETHLTAGTGATLRIGNNSGISNTAITAMKEVTIGDYVLIGSGTMITDTDFHSVQLEYRKESPDIHVAVAPVRIFDGVFIGARSIILKGVTIGENAVIGAGSVVAKNVPANEIWAGNPAKFVKRLNAQ